MEDMDGIQPKRRRIVMPFSRIILMIVLGAIFLVRAAASLFVKSMSMDSSMLLIYFVAGAILLALGVAFIAVRSREQKDR